MNYYGGNNLPAKIRSKRRKAAKIKSLKLTRDVNISISYTPPIKKVLKPEVKAVVLVKPAKKNNVGLKSISSAKSEKPAKKVEKTETKVEKTEKKAELEKSAKKIEKTETKVKKTAAKAEKTDKVAEKPVKKVEEPKAEEVTAEVVSEEPKTEEVPIEVVPEEPKAEEVPIEVVPEEPKTEEVPIEVVPEEPKAEEVPAEVIPEEPKAEEVPIEVVPEEPKTEEVTAEEIPEEPKAEEVPIEVIPEEPKAEEVPIEVIPEEPKAEEVPIEVIPEEKPAVKPAEEKFKLDATENADLLPRMATKRARKLIYAPKEAIYEVTGIKIDVDGKKNDKGVKVKDILEAEIKEGLKLGYLDKYDGLKTSEIKEEYENDTVWEIAEQEFKKMGLLLDGDKIKVYVFDYTGSGCHHIGYIPDDAAKELMPYLKDMDKYSFDLDGIITGGKSKTVTKDPSTGKITITKGKDGNYGVDLDVTIINRKD